MKRIAIVLTVLTFAFSTVVPAQAATKATTVSTAFRTLLNQSTTALESLEEKYEADIDVLDQALITATKSADATLAQDLQSATDLYAPQILAANSKLDAAKILFTSNSDLKIQQSLFTWQNADRVYSLFICPETTLPAGAGWMEIAKRYCVNENNKPRPGDISTKTTSKNTIGGEDWQSGETAKISLSSASNKDLLYAISYGWLVPVNLSAFDSSRLAIATETANVADLTQKNGKARIAAQSKRDSAVASAVEIRESGLVDLDEAFEIAKAQLEAQETAANLGLLAAKRASKDAAKFDAAFVTAYKFEYNRQMVGQIADSAWNGEWTYRTIDTIIEVNKLAAYGDAVGRKYSMNDALKFNSAVGGAFTNELEFRAALKVLTATYKKVTKVNLKF
jgi:hypothetical protein